MSDVAEEQTEELVHIPVVEQTRESLVSMLNVSVEKTWEPMVQLEDVSPPSIVWTSQGM